VSRFWILDASTESILSTAEGLSTGFGFGIAGNNEQLFANEFVSWLEGFVESSSVEWLQ
jgi:hypothetical protein